MATALVGQFKKSVGTKYFQAQFIKIISHNKRIVYNIACMLGDQPNQVSSLIPRRWVGPQTLLCFQLKDLYR